MATTATGVVRLPPANQHAWICRTGPDRDGEPAPPEEWNMVDPVVASNEDAIWFATESNLVTATFTVEVGGGGPRPVDAELVYDGDLFRVGPSGELMVSTMQRDVVVPDVTVAPGYHRVVVHVSGREEAAIAEAQHMDDYQNGRIDGGVASQGPEHWYVAFLD